MKRALTLLFLLVIIPNSIAAQGAPNGTQGSKSGDKSADRPATLKLYDVPAPQEFGGQSQDEVAEYLTITKATEPKEQAELIEAFLKKYPRSQYNLQLHQQAAEDYQKTNNPEKLIEHGEAALTSSPNNALLLAVLALTYATRGDAEKAIDRGSKAVSVLETLEPSPNADPTIFAAQRNRYLAISYTSLGTAFLIRYEAAKKAALQETSQSKGQSSVPGEIGSATPPVKSSEESKTSAAGKSPTATTDPASLDLSKAKGYYSRALELNSDYEFAEFQLAVVCTYERQVAPALEAFSKVIAMGGSMSALAKENFERIYKISHNNSLDGSEELLEKARSAWAEKKQTTK
jgi:tetratricopeptide (TPR) repeat protein